MKPEKVSTRQGELIVTLVGTKPMLVANGEMAITTSEACRAYRALRATKPNTRAKHTKEHPEIEDAWYAEEEKLLARYAYYYDKKVGMHMPCDNLVQLALDATKPYLRTGTRTLQRVLEVDEELIPIVHDGPGTPEERVEKGFYRAATTTNKNMGGARVRVVQGRFDTWKIPRLRYVWSKTIEPNGVLGKNKEFDADLFLRALESAGELVGIGAYRKAASYGKFEVIPWTIKNGKWIPPKEAK